MHAECYFSSYYSNSLPTVIILYQLRITMMWNPAQIQFYFTYYSSNYGILKLSYNIRVCIHVFPLIVCIHMFLPILLECAYTYSPHSVFRVCIHVFPLIEFKSVHPKRVHTHRIPPYIFKSEHPKTCAYTCSPL